ncbi:sodium/proline symporter [Thermosinus carboxydivorans Nor1]|uniref:Sodium/proline symporter n=1 Tax=Thermosinus carboxydivorans Nor1 TaxID=401526 RepID=A1HTL0_9FIRM|nr:sodium/proline symporter PutP [Thermosinus carboxydivorans]EAX46623.1 sodium/proline symporter [Thermosinus carboxydivorans Nor1]
MTGYSTGVLAAFILYLIGMMLIGVIYYRKTHSMSEYILGGRQLGAWVTSMSAEASDMSGWMLMGLPGFAYSSGLQAGWIALGLILGTWANWVFVAKRLRKYTQIANDSLTLPDYFQNRFRDTSQTLRIVSAIFILIFFLIYTSSGFVAGGKLFHTVFGIPYAWAMVVGAFVIVFYTFLGGFMAVCWTDFVQGVMMFFAILVVPIAAMMLIGGPAATYNTLHTLNSELFNPFTNPDGKPLSIVAIVSLLAWGLGYFGQPHILVRFMAIRSSAEIKHATRIAMTWVVLSLAAAVLVGMVGRVYLKQPLTGADVETVFLVMANDLFSSFFAGVVLSAVLAAIMSTASSQLLVTASAFSQDFYKALIRPTASEHELVWISRLTVVAVTALGVLLGLDPNNFILDLVAYAWAGFGAAFGPMILMSLFWKRMTRNGALAGIIVGGLTVLIWKQFAWLGLYEIVPGFAFSLLAIYIVSLLDDPPAQEIMDEFEKVNNSDI